MKIEQVTTQHLVDSIHFTGSCLVKLAGSHIIIRLSQSKPEVSHALIGCYHGNQCNRLNRENSQV